VRTSVDALQIKELYRSGQNELKQPLTFPAVIGRHVIISNKSMTLIHLAHCNGHLFITTIAYHSWLNFTRSTSATGRNRRRTLARRRTSGSTSRSAINSHRVGEEVESEVQIQEVSEEITKKVAHSSPRRPI
jgi:hypothetical protein